MPSYCKVALILALVAPVFAATADASSASVRREGADQATLSHHTGRLGSNPMNGHKHNHHRHKLAHRIKKLEQEYEALSRTVFDMEHFFAGFSHVISEEGHRDGFHFKHHHHKHHCRPGQKCHPRHKHGQPASGDETQRVSHKLSHHDAASPSSEASGSTQGTPAGGHGETVSARDVEDWDEDWEMRDDEWIEEREFDSLEELD